MADEPYRTELHQLTRNKSLTNSDNTLIKKRLVLIRHLTRWKKVLVVSYLFIHG